MLVSLIEEAESRKGKIKDDIEEYESQDLNIEGKWFDKTIPINKPCPIGAGDGSFNKKRFISFFLYAVSVESVKYIPNENTSSTEDSSTLGTMPHNLKIDAHLSNYMNIFELKSAIQTLKDKNIKYYLFDGSIYGDLIWLFSYGNNIRKTELKELIEKFSTTLKEDLFKYKLTSKTLLDEDFDEYSEDKYFFLEDFEKTLLLSELLKDKKRIVAISKTSDDTNILERGIPDIALFNFFSKEEGYSETHYIDLKDKEFPVYNSFFQSLEFTIFYARLEPYKSVLKFEVPYYASREECLEILADLKRDCVEGYPYLLYKAHHEVVISNKDMNSISSIIGIIQRQGREML